MRLGFIRQCVFLFIIVSALAVSGCSGGAEKAAANDGKAAQPGKGGGAGKGQGQPGGGGAGGGRGGGRGGAGGGQVVNGVKLVPVSRIAVQREIDVSGTLL